MITASEDLINAAGDDNALAGVIDIHYHCGPDSFPGTIDSIDLATIARQMSMRAIVLTNPARILGLH